MPEYLAPGVYIEETSFRAKSIEGVSTTTTGFVGPTRYGPLDLAPDIVTSLVEFERVYGDGQKLNFNGTIIDNYMWHATRAFFEEGGKRLYIARAFRANGADNGLAATRVPGTDVNPAAGTVATDPIETQFPNDVHIRARFPGAAGNVHVRFQLKIGQNIATGTSAALGLASVLDGDVVWVGIHTVVDAKNVAPTAGTLNKVVYNSVTQKFSVKTFANADIVIEPDKLDEVRIVTLAVVVTLQDGSDLVWDGLAPEPSHTRAGTPDSLTTRFGVKPASLAQARSLPIVITKGDSVTSGLLIIQKLFNADAAITANTGIAQNDANGKPKLYMTSAYALQNGDDGLRPTDTEYTGVEKNDGSKTGLKAFEDIEDISIVAAPGATYNFDTTGQAIINALLTHARNMRYRIAVLDSGNAQSIAEVRAMRAKLDSTYGALYYPWVKVLDPITRTEIPLPPSGFVAGIYARNDINRAVWKAPANEVVNGAIGFEVFLNKAQQDILNPEGINAFRYFEGRGFRLWGARTISSDPEWKYVNLRRYFCYLERSIDRGTQWAVFEPNGEALWANVRRTIEDFLFNEWSMGALLGDKPEKAYFVKCDRSTMTQNDLDNGRLVCLIGVAPLRPAEFVIFRIGQWTGDRKV